MFDLLCECPKRERLLRKSERPQRDYRILSKEQAGGPTLSQSSDDHPRQVSDDEGDFLISKSSCETLRKFADKERSFV